VPEETVGQLSIAVTSKQEQVFTPGYFVVCITPRKGNLPSQQLPLQPASRVAIGLSAEQLVRRQ